MLVIIGLLAGGILVGRDLIGAASVRSQIAQIQQYQTAANTFRGKYNNYLPGDIPEPHASQFGFKPRGPMEGQGDGNEAIEGVDSNSPSSNGIYQSAGETVLFWSDLADAKLIGGNFSFASASYSVGSRYAPFNNRFPDSVIRQSGYLYVFNKLGVNYLALSGFVQVWNGYPYGEPLLTAKEAYSIDAKIDDGVPQAGRVLAGYLGFAGATNAGWIMDYGVSTSLIDTFPSPYYNTVANPSSTSCVDNDGVLHRKQEYSVSSSTALACGISIKFN